MLMTVTLTTMHAYRYEPSASTTGTPYTVNTTLGTHKRKRARERSTACTHKSHLHFNYNGMLTSTSNTHLNRHFTYSPTKPADQTQLNLKFLRVQAPRWGSEGGEKHCGGEREERKMSIMITRNATLCTHTHTRKHARERSTACTLRNRILHFNCNRMLTSTSKTPLQPTLHVQPSKAS